MTQYGDVNGRAALDAALSRLQLELPEAACAKLLEYLDRLFEENRKVNLTRVDSAGDAVVRHLEDSLAVLPEFGCDSDPFCDLGTGGGVPGVPLAIVSGRNGVLLDSVKKKAHAVERIVDALGLGDRLRVRGVRSEELALEKPESFATVVVRAVSSLPAVMELAAPLLSQGGHLVAMRAVESAEVVDHAKEIAPSLGLSYVSERSFVIGEERFNRSVYLFARSGEAQMHLPRRVGLAQKRPL